MGRSPCCSKEGMNRGSWTAMEDKILTDYIKIHGEGKWRNLPRKAGLQRCGKSCRLRWLNYLRPDIKRGNITHDEEELIVRLHKLLGNRWSLIAGRLPGRTDNEIKNYWNTNIGKRMQNKKSSTSNPTPSNQSEDKRKHTIEHSIDHCVVRTKATRCTTKVFIPSDPQKTDQLDTKPLVGPSTVQDLPENVPELCLSSISDEKNRSDFMMDLEMDDHFLSELLNTNVFSQLCDSDNDLQGDNINTNTSHGSQQSSPNSDQTLLFSDDRLCDSDFPAMASFLDSEMDWFGD